MEQSNLIQIGEFARRAGTNLRTLRYYEELNLLKPAARSDGGFRYYSENQLDRVSAIKRLQDLGLPLKEIAEALAMVEPWEGPQVVHCLRAALDTQIGLIGTRMSKLQRDLDELGEARKKLVSACDRCHVPFSREHCDPCQVDSEPMPAALRALL